MFRTAKPIYVKELSGVMNAFATFAAQVDSLSGAELHICAVDLYRVSVNGRFVASGPARTAKGYARMDCIPLDGLGRKSGNQIIISVLGYGCRSLSTVLQPMFLWAEVVRNGEVLAATGRISIASFPMQKNANARGIRCNAILWRNGICAIRSTGAQRPWRSWRIRPR